jgi:molybdopterin-guanine dinucleotide biosynthesis protein
MKVVGFAGFSGSGKTSLVEGLIPHMPLKGLRVSVVKHAQSKQPARYREDAFIVAIATDSPEQVPQATLRPVLDINDAAELAQWLTRNEARFDHRPENFV